MERQKSEWATKRHNLLYVGSSGNELARDGVVTSKDLLGVDITLNLLQGRRASGRPNDITYWQKSEWATKRHNLLYVGSSGNELARDGVVTNKDLMWIKVINPEGLVTHVNWENRYDDLRKQVGIQFPGSLVHESALWSDVHQRWFFMPLRKLEGPFDRKTYPHLSTNILLSADANFEDIKNITVGDVHGDHGFCSFKFIPGTDDNVVVALKSEDQVVDGKPQYSTHIMVFLIDGTVIQDELRISDLKFEGIEFI
ncbi:Soluble calcium-activated nucleotidase 1 [Homalodisca vitripennis]|nr:Soluble calcium-activated nucleotidase 1 [Homalodisca vitripennis]